MPWHPCNVLNRQSIAYIVSNLLEVHYACIVVVLTWKQRLRKVSGVHVCEGMVVSVPASEAEIKAANGCILIVDNDNFFVMRPDFNAIYSMLYISLR